MRFFRANEIADQTFYQVPKSLFSNPRYQENKDLNRKALSLEGKMVYAILRDRMNLSQKNGWINENDEVFLKFKRADLMQLLECGWEKMTKVMKELNDYELIYEKKLGRGMTNEIYICHVELEEKTPSKAVNSTELRKPKNKNFENRSSRTSKIEDYSNTDISNTDISKTTTKGQAVVVPSATPKETDEEKEVIAKAEICGIKKATIKKYIKQQGLDNVLIQINNLDNAIIEGNKHGNPISNPGAWLYTALKEGFIDTKAIQKAKSKEKADTIKKAAEEALFSDNKETTTLDPSSPFTKIAERLGVLKAM